MKPKINKKKKSTEERKISRRTVELTRPELENKRRLKDEQGEDEECVRREARAHTQT